MRHQSKPYSCGIASIANALECLGIKRTQGAIMRVCHCTPENGTPEEEIQRGLLACGAQVDVWLDRSGVQSELWLRHSLCNGWPVILCLDSWEHWSTAIGILGTDRYLVFDPALGAGIKMYTAKALLTRWRLGKRSGGPSYYGIGCSK